MIVVRDQIRLTMVRDLLTPISWVEPQWSLVVLFLVLLASAVAVVIWMIRQLLVERSQ